MHTLILYRGKFSCGNFSTASHLSDLLASKTSTQLVEVSDISSLIEQVDSLQNRVTAIIGIHLFYSGRAILELRDAGINVPYILVVGGTDVNEFWRNEDAKTIMASAVFDSSYVVCFSEELHMRCIKLFGCEISGKLQVIQPGVEVLLTAPASVSKSPIHAKLPTVNFERYVVVVANIRPVKDVLFLAVAFSEFVEKNHVPLAMIIVGSILDENYALQVLEKIKTLKSVFYLGSFPKKEAQELISGAVALVNSSISEGVSVAIIEAMVLKTLVIARNIPGNAAIIRHLENGLLYSEPAEFIELLKLILCDNNLREKLTLQAFSYVEKHHNVMVEKSSYQKLLLEIFNSKV